MSYRTQGDQIAAFPEFQKSVEFGSSHPVTGTVAFVVNTDWFFLSHRASWATSALAGGARVVVLARDTGRANELRDLGIEFIDIDLGREKIAPTQALRASIVLTQRLRSLSPTTVFLIATAAYTVGTLATVLMPRTKFVSVITGSGRALEQTGLRSRVVTTALRLQARLRRVKTLFQLDTDRIYFIQQRLAAECRSTVIGGTGLDVELWYAHRDEDHSVLTVLFAARLFQEKGVYDFVEVARRLRRSGVRFLLAGDTDTGVSTAVTTDELDTWAADGIVVPLGRRSDMPQLLAGTDLLVAPSTHPEGTPKALIEAAASGLPVVAYQQPGVDLVLDHGRAGIIVAPNDVLGLVEAVDRLLRDVGERKRLGQAAHAHAKATFHIEEVLQCLYEFAFQD